MKVFASRAFPSWRSLSLGPSCSEGLHVRGHSAWRSLSLRPSQCGDLCLEGILVVEVFVSIVLSTWRSSLRDILIAQRSSSPRPFLSAEVFISKAFSVWKSSYSRPCRCGVLISEAFSVWGSLSMRPYWCRGIRLRGLVGAEVFIFRALLTWKSLSPRPF